MSGFALRSSFGKFASHRTCPVAGLAPAAYAFFVADIPVRPVCHCSRGLARHGPRVVDIERDYLAGKGCCGHQRHALRRLKAVPSTLRINRDHPGAESEGLGPILAEDFQGRSAVESPKGKRVEVRYADPAANPYLAFAAMLMAGIDGIQNRIHPGDPIDKNLYDLPPEELTDIPVVCGSLREAIGELRADHAFLLKGDVFNMDQIEAYMELKWEEVYAFEHTPHPIEFQMYYSV